MYMIKIAGFSDRGCNKVKKDWRNQGRSQDIHEREKRELQEITNMETLNY